VAKRGRGTSRSKNSPQWAEIPVPSEISELIVGRTVRVDEPNGYYAQLWKARMPAVEQHVSEVTPYVFKLDPQFFDRFRFYLCLHFLPSKKSQHTNYTPSDRIADALCETAEEFLFYRSDVGDNDLWPTNRDISEAWQRLTELPLLTLGLR
jgi:hypothetical protein